MTIPRHRLWAIILPLVLACSPDGAKRDQLVVAHKGLPLSLVPHTKSEVISISIQANLFEALVDFDPTMKIRPLLAETWENPDDLTWIFKLKRGVKFHDGSSMTADDVVFSLERAKSYENSDLKGNFVAVDSIVKIDDYTVKLRTKKPYPILLNKLLDAFIVPAKALQGRTDQEFEQKPIGTGPFRFLSLVKDRELRLARWDSYWGPKPDFGLLVFVPYTLPDEAEQLMRLGKVDIVSEINPTLAKQLEAKPIKGFSIEHLPGPALRYIGINTRIKPFNNPKLRQAISLAVDRQLLIDKIILGFGTPANQLVPQAIFGYDPSLPQLEFDPAKAKKLLASAGYPRGLDLTLLISDTRVPFGEELQRQLAEAGIRISLNIKGMESFFDTQDTSSFFLLGSVSMSGDASDVFDDVIHSPGKGYGRDNKGRYLNPKLDRLIESSSGYLNQAQRLKTLQETMRLAMQDLPRVPLYIEDDIYAVSDRVTWQPRLDMMVFAKEVHKR